MFLFPIELQVVSGCSALQAGLALLPVTFLLLALSLTSARASPPDWAPGCRWPSAQ